MSAPIRTPIRLDQFLKLATSLGSGGAAKMLIQSGAVSVNGELETHRRRQLQGGDRVEVDFEGKSESFVVPGDGAP